MNTTISENLETAVSNNKPARVIRRGAIAASVWKRQRSSGDYFDFSLSRSWKSTATGNEGYSSNFYETNATELVIIIQEAALWIAQNSASGSEPAE